MYRWLRPSAHHSLVLFVILGLLSVVLAWNTFDLIRVAMANLDYLGNFGLYALREGGAVQLTILLARGALSLVCYLGFKGIEDELTDRWRK